MAVAKSFQNMEILCEPFKVGGKMYVRVRSSTGRERQVRWYTDAEYAKLYPEEKKVTVASTQREALGFTKGYITIFKGDTYPHLEWFQNSIARYCKLWGWYIISTEEVPSDLPSEITPIKLNWEDVGLESGALKIEAEVKKAIDNIIYDEDPSSNYVGNIGDRLTLSVTITSNHKVEGAYGTSTIHTMKDENNNVFVWITSAKDWPVGTEKTIKGTVKDQKIFRGIKQNILTRCVCVE
jgi:hypothetical protein